MRSMLTRDSQARNMPGGQILAPPSPFIGILPQEMWQATKQFYATPLTFLNLTKGVSQSVTIQADPARDIVVYQGAYTARSADNQTKVTGPCILLDMASAGGSSFNPSNQPNDIENMLGSAQMPTTLGVPIIIPAGQSLTITLQSLHDAVLNVRITLGGFQVRRENR